MLIRIRLDRIKNINDNANDINTTFVNKLSNNIQMIIKDKIIKILTKVDIDNAGKILAKILLSRIDNTNDNTNNIDTHKIIVDINKMAISRYLL